MTLTTTYTLDKPYSYECFDESVAHSKRAQPKYFLLALLVALGLFGIYGLDDHYLGSFLIMVAVLECIAFYYRRPWWVTRQMLSKASGLRSPLPLTKKGLNRVTFIKTPNFCGQILTKL